MEYDPLIPEPNSFHPVYFKERDFVLNLILFQDRRSIIIPRLTMPITYYADINSIEQDVMYTNLRLNVSFIRRGIPDSHYVEEWKCAMDQYKRHICTPVLSTVWQKQYFPPEGTYLKPINKGGLL